MSIIIRTKSWNPRPTAVYCKGDLMISEDQISNYIKHQGIDTNSNISISLDDIAEFVFGNKQQQSTTTDTDDKSTDTDVDDISSYTTEDLIGIIESKSSTLNRSSFKALKEDLTVLICSHLHPKVVEDKDDVVGVEKYTDDDLESTITMAMLQEFVTSKNTKKRDAIRSAVDKYGKKSIVEYVCAVSNLVNSMVWRLYSA